MKSYIRAAIKTTMMIKTCKYLFSLSLICAAFGATAQNMDGYAIYNQGNSNTAYLIDSEGEIAHIWSCPSAANYALALTNEGNLVRGAKVDNAQIDGPATGGMVQELDADGDVVWEFEYSSNEVISHHDIALMPNGNVLMIAWELIDGDVFIDMGYEDDSDIYASHLIEVQQDGTGGEIVWEWHVIDHLVQDVDETKPSFGDVSENWQLLNINVPAGTSGGQGGGGPLDWLHVNGLDYNETLDQIVFTSRYLSEIFVIDHSTSTMEAASHEGGNSGMGGDFLYRWGNPDNYDTPGTQVIPAATHDARWIKEGRPNAGWIQIFNNEGGSGGSSTVDAINAPHDGFVFEKTEGAQFEPTSYSWRHECEDDASGQSASDRMTNGNVFVNLSGGFGGGGFMYEANEDGTIVWQYNSDSQKAFRYECDHPGIQALLDNPCEGTSISELSVLPVTVFPNPSTDGQFKVIGEFGLNGLDQILVHDMYGNLVADLYNTNRIDMSGMSAGFYVATLTFKGRANTRKLTIAQ